LWTIVDPCDKPTLLRIIYSGNTCTTEVLDEFGESHPSCRVHVQMVLVLNILLIHLVGPHPLGPKSISAHISSLCVMYWKTKHKKRTSSTKERQTRLGTDSRNPR